MSARRGRGCGVRAVGEGKGIDSMEYRVHQPGYILQLRDDLPDVYAGFYVLPSCGDAFTLAGLGEDETGNLCATST